jgi:hypothetical protein
MKRMGPYKHRRVPSLGVGAALAVTLGANRLPFVGSIVALLLLSTVPVAAEPASDPSRQTYRDERNGFEFHFPASMKFNARFGSGELEDPREQRRVLTTEVWPPDECLFSPGEKKVTSAKEVAARRAIDVCQADGPNGSSYCTGPVTVSPFKSNSGAEGFEMHLTRVSEFCETDEEDNCTRPMTKTVDGKRGPVYAFDISTEEMTKILYVEPSGIDPAAASPDARPDLRLIRQILSTVKVFKVESPKVTCIQDLPPFQGFALPVRPNK